MAHHRCMIEWRKLHLLSHVSYNADEKTQQEWQWTVYWFNTRSHCHFAIRNTRPWLCGMQIRLSSTREIFITTTCIYVLQKLDHNFHHIHFLWPAKERGTGECQPPLGYLPRERLGFFLWKNKVFYQRRRTHLLHKLLVDPLGFPSVLLQFL